MESANKIKEEDESADSDETITSESRASDVSENDSEDDILSNSENNEGLI